MAYWGWNRDDRTENERYLEDQLEREREYRRQEEERRQRESELRREEMRSRIEEDWRRANTWPEALNKQAALFGRESAEIRRWHLEDPESAADFPDDLFGPGAAACLRALELWPEAEAAVANEIAALEAKIAELRKSVARTVADQLDAENVNDEHGWRHVAGALRETEEEPGALHNWLYW